MKSGRIPPKDAALSELQTWMCEILRSPRGLTRSKEMREAAALHFTGNDRLTPAEQIDIYRRQFWLRHTSLLVEDFPGLTALLGQSRWEPICESYLNQRGGDVFALRDLPLQMPEHLKTLPDLPDRDLLLDMARLECAYLSAFDAVDDPELSQAALAQIPEEAWESASFELSHSLTLLRVRYPVAELRRALKNDSPTREALSPSVHPQNLVIYRRDRQLWDKPVSDIAFLLLQQFAGGKTLGEACTLICENHSDAEALLDRELFAWFALWGRLGWIVGVKAA